MQEGAVLEIKGSPWNWEPTELEITAIGSWARQVEAVLGNREPAGKPRQVSPAILEMQATGSGCVQVSANPSERESTILDIKADMRNKPPLHT